MQQCKINPEKMKWHSRGIWGGRAPRAGGLTCLLPPSSLDLWEERLCLKAGLQWDPGAPEGRVSWHILSFRGADHPVRKSLCAGEASQWLSLTGARVHGRHRCGSLPPTPSGLAPDVQWKQLGDLRS